jgi:outer membrane protein TolC
MCTQAQNIDFYIQKGLKNSPLITDYNNRLLSKKLDSLLIQASHKPQVNQVSQAMYAPHSGNFGYDEAITNGANFSSVINVVQPLFNKALKINQYQGNFLDKKAIETDLSLTETDLKQGITAQYLIAYADLEQRRFNLEILEQLKKQQDILRVLVEKGIFAQSDVLNLEIAIAAQKIAIGQSTLRYHTDLALLNFICGMSDTTTVWLQKPELKITNRFDLHHTPTMVKFSVDSLQIENERRSIDLSYHPKLSAFADAGFMAILPQHIPRNFGSSIGLNFSVPVYDGNQRKLQYQKLQLEENSRINYKTVYANQYKQQIDQLSGQLEETDELITNIAEQLEKQEKLIELYKVEIEKGMVRWPDYLNVITNYTQNKYNLISAEVQRLQIINQMNYLK